jgi:hypothetical protein
MITGIYKITCKETGRCYIGQSKHIKSRWKTHQKKRFPSELFDYEIIVQCFNESESLDFWERRCIEDYDAHVSKGGYNLTKGGNGAWNGNKTMSDESRKKISNTLKGQKHTDERRKNQSNAAKNRPPMSDDTKQKLSKVSKGRIVSEETKQKLANAARKQHQRMREVSNSTI